MEQREMTSSTDTLTASNEISFSDIAEKLGFSYEILQRNKSFNTSVSQLQTPYKEFDSRDLLVKTIQGKYGIFIENLKEYLQLKLDATNQDCPKRLLFTAIFGCGNSVINLLNDEQFRGVVREFAKAMIEKRREVVNTLTFQKNDILLSVVFEMPQTETQIMKNIHFIEKEYNTMFWNTIDSKYGDEKMQKYLFEIMKVSINFSQYSFYKTFEDFKDIKNLPSPSEFKEKLKMHNDIGIDINSKMKLLMEIFESK
jgi:hypothetical protein